MAVSAGSRVRVYSTRALDRIIFENPWRGVVDDRSMEMGGRASMVITDTKRGITLNARANNWDSYGTVQQPDTQDFTLSIDKKFGFNESVPTLDEMEVGPSLAAAVDRWSMNRVINQISGDIRAKVDAATPRQTFDIDLKTDGTNGPQLRNEAGQTAIVNLFSLAEEYADGAGFPGAAGDMEPSAEGIRFAVVNPSIKAAVMRYLRDKGTDMSTGLARMAFMGQDIPVCHGWGLIVDRSIPGVSTAAGQNQYKVYFGLRGWTIPFAQQINRTRVIPDPDAPQDLFQGLLQYGALVPEAVSVRGTTSDAWSDVAAGSANATVRYAETLMVGQFDFAAS